MRTVVKWSGDINFEYPTDIAPTVPYRVIANTAFTIEGWLFKDAAEPVGKIYKIDTSFTALSDLDAKYETMLGYVDVPLNTDVFILSGRPQVKTADPWLMIPCVDDKRINIYGTWFDTLCTLYVSGTSGVFVDQTWHNPASGNHRISAMYPGFSGVEIEDWIERTPTTLTFTMPSAATAGYIDVIAFNEAGYGRLTQDAIRTTLNPYVSGTSEYDNYEEWQHPSVSGVRVDPFYYYC